MDQLIRKELKVSRGFTYCYYTTESATNADKPTILLCHGFPDSAHLYAFMLPNILPLGFPLLLPDMLGYAGTSKPTDPSLFNSKDMSNDLCEILDEEEIRSVILVGHDWGSFMVSRFYQWHPERVVGLICLNVAYMPPDAENRFDLQAANQYMEQVFGAPLFAYWDLFTAPDGAEIIENHLESFWTVLHGDEPHWMHKMFCVPNAMREYLLADKRIPLKPYAQDPALKDTFINRMKRDGLKAPLQWYCATVFNHEFEAMKQIPKENYTVKVPHLFIGCTGDDVCRIDQVKGPIDAGLLPDFTYTEVICDHWSPFEKPDELSQAIVSFLKKKF